VLSAALADAVAAGDLIRHGAMLTLSASGQSRLDRLMALPIEDFTAGISVREIYRGIRREMGPAQLKRRTAPRDRPSSHRR
jgi:hypothetical protein